MYTAGADCALRCGLTAVGREEREDDAHRQIIRNITKGVVHARVRHSVLECNVFKTKLAKWPIFGLRGST